MREAGYPLSAAIGLESLLFCPGSTFAVSTHCAAVFGDRTPSFDDSRSRSPESRRVAESEVPKWSATTGDAHWDVVPGAGRPALPE